MRRGVLLRIVLVTLAAATAFLFQKRVPVPPLPTNTIVEKPNVLLVTIDTLRADHLGAYGYQAIQTPAIDALARGGVLFRQALCQTPLTLVSHSSIFTGLNPNVHGVRDNAYFNLSSKFKTLAEYLKESGYTTAAFIGSAILDRRHGLAQGFDWYSRYQPTAVIGLESQRRGEEVVSEALEWLQKTNEKKPLFLWIHLYDPHSPYDAPEPYRSKYPRIPYDGEIAYTDHVLEQFFQQLKKLGFLRDAILIVMGDHGESLGEHGEPDHGYFVYDATIKIPLILSWPGNISPKIVEQQAQEIDILPTIADLVGFDMESAIQGKSLRPFWEGTQSDFRSAYLESMTPKLYYGWSELVSLRSKNWKYIEAPKPELYDLKADPSEQNNLVTERADLARQMREQLLKWVQTGLASQNGQSQSLDAERLEQLAALGYIGATNPAAALHQHSNVDPKDRIDDYRMHHQLIPEAISQIDRGQFAQALQTLKTVEAKFSNSFVLDWYMGLCYARLNRLEEARRSYSHTIELNPYFGRAYTDLALTLQVLGHHQEAIKLLDTIPPAALSVSDREFTRGEIQMNQQNFREAERAYESSLQSDPQNSETEYALARLYLATGRIEEALTKMRELASVHYPSEDVYYSLSAIYQKQGNQQAAAEVLQQWLQIFPNSADACYRYGIFLVNTGNRQQGIVYLKKAIQIDPSMKEAAQALNRLKGSF